MRPIGFLRYEEGEQSSGEIGFAKQEEDAQICKEGNLIIPCNFTHAAIIGETGCGKTTSMIYPNLLDRMQRGHGIFVFDYKGCEESAVKALAKRAGRLKDVVVVGTFLGEKINLIKDISGRDFKNTTSSLMKTIDSFWQEYGANLTLSIFNFLKALGEFTDIVGKHNIRGFAQAVRLSDAYPFNIHTIRNLTQDILKFTEFLASVNGDLKLNLDQVVNEKKEVRLRLKDLLASKQNLIDIMGRFDLTKAKNEERVINDFRNLSIMATVINELADDETVNADKNSISQYLNEGKIVVFNAINSSSQTLAMLLDSFIPSFIKRAGGKNLIPISLFLDETAKIAGKNSNFHEEILRQSKVELILAFQNESTLKKELGYDKYEALIGNMVDIYLMKNKSLFTIGADAVNCSKLKPFECLHDGERNLLKPMFIDEIEKREATYEFELINKLQEKILEKKAKGCVMKFNEWHFRNGQITLVDVKSGKEKIGELKDSVLGI
ncbi:type IV secretory system conjugative DNA transfer family protein [uncultured Campylobacter sp.]|uniref:type IV secretory system conjugative DNA transfer family protein n=1 Tax=uncultured Campylobacter sp. TaxID=218934 RepID=UPI00262C51F7|nr:type IV secretory system conjugative DNA transfer family protein [uncultured Campylobacter sp.]